MCVYEKSSICVSRTKEDGMVNKFELAESSERERTTLSPSRLLQAQTVLDADLILKSRQTIYMCEFVLNLIPLTTSKLSLVSSMASHGVVQEARLFQVSVCRYVGASLIFIDFIAASFIYCGDADADDAAHQSQLQHFRTVSLIVSASWSDTLSYHEAASSSPESPYHTTMLFCLNNAKKQIGY